MTMVIDGSLGITFPDTSRQYNSYYNFKNRIINGAMVIDQRNAGASVTPANNTYTLDRWKNYQTTASKYSVQRNAGSVTPPAGYTNYLGITSLSSYAVLSSDYYTLQQVIEGFNAADLAWGTANAQTVTLSFWVRSSLTGTFGGSIFNGAGNRSYPFNYTISAANTWEQKSITIPGDTTGTWATDNTAGIQVCFGLGAGSTFSGTAGAWAGSLFVSTTGATSVVGTNGATFYITGVQLEEGIVSTPFDFRPYGTELALCQRYYTRLTSGGAGPFAAFGNGIVVSSTAGTGFMVRLPTTMRAPPTPTVSNCRVYDGSAAAAVTAIAGATDACNPNALGFDLTVSGAALTAFRPSILQGNNNAAAFIEASAEL
jgi:hypothetical protein